LGLIVSQILLFAIVLSLSSIFKKTQDEVNFIKGKATTYAVNILCAVSVFSLIGLTFYPEYFIHVSVNLKLVDNVLFPIMMMSTFFLSLILYQEIKYLSCVGRKIQNGNDEKVIEGDFKIYFIILMGLQTFLCKFIFFKKN
jgi:hypothetical protein